MDNVIHYISTLYIIIIDILLLPNRKRKITYLIIKIILYTYTIYELSIKPKNPEKIIMIMGDTIYMQQLL